ncbi:Engulfment and cell motility protein 1, partial [Exaiptasia diaphana]
AEAGDYYPIFFTTDYGFEEFFCICIQLVFFSWKERKAFASDFTKVIATVKIQIFFSLAEKQHTMEAFRRPQTADPPSPKEYFFSAATSTTTAAATTATTTFFQQQQQQQLHQQQQ